MAKFKTFFCLLCLLGIVLILGCTNNPFFKDKAISLYNLVIRGNIDTGISPAEGAYVWLEGINISTKTDAKGEFRLDLPPPETLPGGAASWNGIYKLYYYIANYSIKSSTIIIRNGEVEYGTGDLDENGNITNNPYLAKLIDIETKIQPTDIRSNFPGNLIISLILKNLIGTVTVSTFKSGDEDFGSIIFREIGAADEEAEFVINSSRVVPTIISGATTWQMIFPWNPLLLEQGTYEVIPFLKIEQESLPEELIKSIGENADNIGPEYLKIPFKWQTALLNVQEGDD